MSASRHSFLPWLPLSLYLAYIRLSSSLSNPAPELTGLFPDWLLHSVGYGFLALLVAAGLTRLFRLPLDGDMIAIVIILGVATAMGDELHQSLTPGRTPSVIDLLADTTGIVTMTAVMRSRVFRFLNRVVGNK